MATLTPAITLDAAITVGEALSALAVYDDVTLVAIRRTAVGGVSWHRRFAGALRPELEACDPDDTVDVALGLGSDPGVSVLEPSDPRARSGEFTGLVVAGDEAIGWSDGPLEAADGEPEPPRRRSWRPPPTAPTAPTSPRGSRRSWQPVEDALEAHPRLDAPERVAPSETFEVVVGLSTSPDPDLPGTAPLRIPTADDVFELTVTLVAHGLDIDGPARRVLEVDRSRLEASTAGFTLLAPATDRPTAARVEAIYSYGGVPVGRAWKQVLVSETSVSSIDRDPHGGSLPIGLSPDAAPDLTVTVLKGTTPGRLMWVFDSPHDVPLPDGQVEGPIVADARSFALDHVKQLSRVDSSPMAPETLTGFARAIAGAAPVEFWTAVDAVWRVAADAGRPPAVMIISDDRYIPWELASTEDDWIDPDLLAPDRPPFLGTQVMLGRWLPAGPATPRGVQRPTLPPVASIGVDRMALVIGDYLAQRGERPLPMAKEEGDALAGRYPHVRMGATAEELKPLLAAELTDGGVVAPVQVVHMACHGEVDPNNAAYNGIVLAGDTLRLDPLTISGTEIGRKWSPLVFLNACQLASDTGDLLADYGGMAGAFLGEGCRAFIAPLWSVNDESARDTALDFYRLTIDEGKSAGEALMQIRSRAMGGGSITPLAYVFYGHPGLRIDLGSDAVVFDLRTEIDAHT